MAEVALKILIAGRVYPLTVKEEEEELVMQVAKRINDKIKEFEQNYSVRDKQDLLAMCALNLLVTEQNIHNNASETEQKIQELNQFVADYLQKKPDAE